MGPVGVLAATAPGDLFGPVVSTRAFAVGLVYGALAFLATGVVAALRHKTHEGGGIAFAVATFLGGRDAFGPEVAPWSLLFALGVLGAGGILAMRMRSRAWARWYVSFGRTAVALAPGALLLAFVFPYDTPTWMRWAAAAGALVAGVLMHDFDLTQGPRGAPFLLLALAAAGVYYTVPDTELALVMVGVSVPLILISVPQPLRRLGPAGTAAVAGAFAWVAVVGARGRAGSVVAAIATLGLLLVEPLGRRVPQSIVVRARRAKRPPTDNWLAVVAVAALAQLALAIFCAKIAGRDQDVMLGLLMTAPALVLLAAAAPFLLPLPDPRRDRRGSGSRRRRARRSDPRKPAWMP
jgi:hypothetical protein